VVRGGSRQVEDDSRMKSGERFVETEKLADAGGRDEALASKQKLRTELSRMIADLNEVRMRLDAVVRKFGEQPMDPYIGQGPDAERAQSEVSDRVEELRVELAKQLDRIRQKLVSRMPEEF